MKISWIIPVFNSGDYLGEAVSSIAENKLADVEFEIIIVDDCSTDKNTIALLHSFNEVDGINVIFQKTNGGPARARNTGIREAHGEWIAFLDSDDLVAPDSFARRIDTIKCHPEIRWIAGDMLELREHGKSTHLKNYEKAIIDGVIVAKDLYMISDATRKLVLWGMLPYLGSMMIRRDLLAQSGSIDENLVYGEDVHFCLVLSRFADLYWINIPCLVLRRYHESMTKDLVRGAKESPRALRACLDDPRLKKVKRELRWRYSADLRQSSGVFLRHGMRLAAINSALRAVLWAPNDRRSLSTLYTSLIRFNNRKG